MTDEIPRVLIREFVTKEELEKLYPKQYLIPDRSEEIQKYINYVVKYDKRIQDDIKKNYVW